MPLDVATDRAVLLPGIHGSRASNRLQGAARSRAVRGGRCRDGWASELTPDRAAGLSRRRTGKRQGCMAGPEGLGPPGLVLDRSKIGKRQPQRLAAGPPAASATVPGGMLKLAVCCANRQDRQAFRRSRRRSAEPASTWITNGAMAQKKQHQHGLSWPKGRALMAWFPAGC